MTAPDRDWLERAIADLPDESPPPGLDKRILVLAAAAPAESRAGGRRRRWRRTLLIATPFLAAAAVLALVLGPWQPHASSRPSLTVEVRQGTVVHRIAVAAIGDVVIATATAPPPAELRLYRNDAALLATCPGAAGCGMRGRTIILEFTATAPGVYRAVLIHEPVVAATSAGLQADLERARAGNAGVVMGAPVEVR
jgi:hypothetical protein